MYVHAYKAIDLYNVHICICMRTSNEIVFFYVYRYIHIRLYYLILKLINFFLYQRTNYIM